MCQKTKEFWIEKYELEKHPFMPGYFKEVFRDSRNISTPEERSASSLIYYLHVPEGINSH